MKTCGTFSQPSPRTGDIELGGACRAKATHLVGIYDTVPLTFMCEVCARECCWDEEWVARIDDADEPGEWGVW
jgi:hypothetical protein